MRGETLNFLGSVIECAALVLVLASVPLHGQDDLPDASVSVVPQPRPNKDAVARVTRVALDGRALKLEIENGGSSPITGLTILYESSSCSTVGVHLWATESSLPQKDLSSPVASSDADTIAELPAHSRIWYDDYRSTTSLANWALHKTTRYVQAQAEVIAVVLKDGSRIQWKQVAAPKQAPDGFDPNACASWPWNDKLNVITGFARYPPETSISASEIATDGVGVTYSCKVIDYLLHCPRR
jgi:hypothetical protein